MRSVLIEPETLCHKLDSISSMVNVLGGFGSGSELAARIAVDMASAARCEIRLGRHVATVHTDDDHVRVVLDSGEAYRAPHTVVATGVRPQTTTEADWITQDRPVSLTALWQADASRLDGLDLVVLGVDRPLGTVLRTHADLHTRLLVLYPAAEGYKAHEVRADKRVTLLPVARLDIRHGPDGVRRLRAVADDGEEHGVVDPHLYLNLGSCPVAPVGDLATDHSGYCPPESQHPRVLVAGDLRGARYQRIMTAFGSGAQAALRAYYEVNEVA
jgi:thioredoxin reductase (NADPH)/alkyl hydroperoxide reductase subunit F